MTGAPYILWVDNLTGQCPTCGGRMMSIRKMESWVCKNCNWRLEEAAMVAEGKEPWTEGLRRFLINKRKLSEEEADAHVQAVKKATGT